MSLCSVINYFWLYDANTFSVDCATIVYINWAKLTWQKSFQFVKIRLGYKVTTLQRLNFFTLEWCKLDSLFLRQACFFKFFLVFSMAWEIPFRFSTPIMLIKTLFSSVRNNFIGLPPVALPFSFIPDSFFFEALLHVSLTL